MVLTQDEHEAEHGQVAADPLTPAPASDNETADAEGLETDGLLEEDQDIGDDLDGEEERYVSIRSSVLAVGLTVSAIVLLLLVAGNVYQFLHNRSESTLATVD